MDWIEGIGEAICYIEANLSSELAIEKIANHVFLSPFYFQRGFSMLCGFTVGDYIRQRRLALAGGELVSTDGKIIDIALKHGYGSPDSFAKAFTRFHGVTPSAVRKTGATLKSFAPLQLSFTLKGGFTMDYKIVEKDSFTVIGALKKFSYYNAKTEIPKFWKEYCQSGRSDTVCGMYGVNIDENMGGKEFEYLIADESHDTFDVPDGFVTRVIPAFTWAVFPCRGRCRTPCRRRTGSFSQSGCQTAGIMRLRRGIMSKCTATPPITLIAYRTRITTVRFGFP